MSLRKTRLGGESECMVDLEATNCMGLGARMAQYLFFIFEQAAQRPADQTSER